LFYRILELSGPNRTSYIPQIIYKYNSGKMSTRVQVSRAVQTKNLNHVRSLKPSKPLPSPVHVVLTVWQRLCLLDRQIHSLSNQSILHKQELVVHILNNNQREVQRVEQLVQKARQTVSEKLQIHVHNSRDNIGAFARFFFVCDIWQVSALDSFVFLDDDQVWPRTFIEELLTQLEPKSSISWYGKVFCNQSAHVADYWRDSCLQMHDIKHHRKQHLTRFSYLGPGGSAFDSNMCTMSNLIRDVYEMFPAYRDFDDIWIS